MDDASGADGNVSTGATEAPPQWQRSDDPNHNHPTPGPQSRPNSASLPAPVKDAQGRILNPRSCVTCRRRKVKCDKTHPCANCLRQHIECVFPTPGRAPRKARKPADPREAELLSRLRRLEGVVKRMGVDPQTGQDMVEGPDDEAAADVDMDQADDSMDAVYGDVPAVRNVANHNLESGLDSQIHHVASGSGSNSESWQERDRQLDQVRKGGGLQHRFGRLVVNEGKSRYVNNSFWANLSAEVEDLKGILNEATDEEEDASPTANAFQSGQQRQGWVFSFSSQNVDLLSLHPIPMQLETYWDIYKENVDPLVKVLHIPSLEPTVLAAASHLANLSKSFEALLFAIYYGAATSLSAEDCIVKLGEERSVLLARYKFAIEQALARANFLTTEELVVLQAFVIFLICLRRNNDARVIWTLTGLVVRIAQTIGIHRDGSHFGLAPFEIEMRRRLWWQVCILDVRASEDHGCDPTITEQSFDTRMPLNVNDIDLDPQTKLLPAEKKGCTDMTFSLIRYEVANTFRRLNYIPPGTPRACGDYFASVSLEDKERWITETHQKLEEKYLKHCDMTVPIYWVTATVARLMMSKMWLMVYHPFQRQGGGKSLSGEIREKLFITSLENIEYSLLLETEARTMKWGWLFRTYMQWHAFAFILVELCHRTRGELVDRAWIAVEKSKDGRWAEVADGARSGHLWRPLTRLMNKALAARKAAQREDQEALAASRRQQAARSVGMSAPAPPAGVVARPRPRVIRAPLSAAQLQRFMSPPVYGNQPIDSTSLMRSPRLKDTIILNDDMDISTLLPELVEQSPPTNEAPRQNQSQPQPFVHEILDQQRLDQQSRAAQLHAQNAAFGTVGPSPLGFRHPFGQAGTSMMSSSGSMAPPASKKATSPPFNFGSPPTPAHMAAAVDTDGHGLGSQAQNTPPGVSPFDASGDIDWPTWDDLVRQFELESDRNGQGNQAGEWGNSGGGAWGGGLF